MTIMSDLLQVRATIYLLDQREGGRHAPVASQYRPAFYIDGRQSDGAIFLNDRDWLIPGAGCEARIAFIQPESFGNALKAGATFEFKEGLKVVGRGTILEVFHKK